VLDLEKLVESAGDAIVAADPEGRIVLWNAAAERIFGYTKADALGATLDLIVPERLRERHWGGYRAVMRSGKTKYGTELLRVPATHRDGRRLSIAFTVTLLPGAIAAIIRDETARWNEERQLRERIKELEAKGA